MAAVPRLRAEVPAPADRHGPVTAAGYRRPARATLSAASDIYVVTGTAHAAAISRQLPEVPAANILVEPSPRDSCAAVSLACAVLARRDPAAIMAAFSADHLIGDEHAVHRGHPAGSGGSGGRIPDHGRDQARSRRGQVRLPEARRPAARGGQEGRRVQGEALAGGSRRATSNPASTCGMPGSSYSASRPSSASWPASGPRCMPESSASQLPGKAQTATARSPRSGRAWRRSRWTTASWRARQPQVRSLPCLPTCPGATSATSTLSASRLPTDSSGNLLIGPRRAGHRSRCQGLGRHLDDRPGRGRYRA